MTICRRTEASAQLADICSAPENICVERSRDTLTPEEFLFFLD
jgi:hypothetical protein